MSEYANPAHAVPCRTCGAVIGEGCRRSVRGGLSQTRVHDQRRKQLRDKAKLEGAIDVIRKMGREVPADYLRDLEVLSGRSSGDCYSGAFEAPDPHTRRAA